MRAKWVGLLGVAAACALVPSLPSLGSEATRMVRDTPLVRPVAVSAPEPSLLVENTFHVTHGIEVGDRLLLVNDDYAIRAGQVAPGVAVEADGDLTGSPDRVGVYSDTVRFCRGPTCLDEHITLVVHRNVPWEPGVLTFPGKVGAMIDSVIQIDGGPPDVLATFTVTDASKLPANVAIGPDGHVGGVPVRPGVSEIPVRICVAGNCAGVVVTLIVV
ncbi:hypothetical protein [Nonomuraea soli]|uniref:Uncharacterized protein n=1 Tax=Nonomuraea soli TaxID=1032476 RepID=A0A7W0HU24_9ACTN|nr:hypothetical protein [Nonomuraea soli]MBA2895316.1 hypothetical protein [Nonomuraea soli]